MVPAGKDPQKPPLAVFLDLLPPLQLNREPSPSIVPMISRKNGEHYVHRVHVTPRAEWTRRRLLYVACTRAQGLLYLSRVTRRKVAGEFKNKELSAFVSDVMNENSVRPSPSNPFLHEAQGSLDALHQPEARISASGPCGDSESP